MDARILMCTVLDGEATPEEGRELQLLVARDPAAAAEYEALRRFFEQVDRVPPIDPPAGLAELAAQHLRVRKSPGIPAAKGIAMNQKLSKRTLWIGTGAVLAAGVIVALFVIPFPPGGKETAGTVVPAQRYRAEQIQAKDVQLGDQAVTQLMQTEAFERIVKDPQMRALALEPGFQALARANVLASMARNVDSFVALAKSREAMAALTKAAEAWAVAGTSVNAKSQVAAATVAAGTATDARLAQATSAEAMTAYAKSFEALSRMTEAREAFAKAREGLEVLAHNPQALDALSRHTDAFALMAREANFLALARNAAFADALSAAASANAMAK